MTPTMVTRWSIILLLVVLAFAIFGGYVIIAQDKVIQTQRYQIRQMTKNPACMIDPLPTFDGDKYYPVPNGPISIQDN